VDALDSVDDLRHAWIDTMLESASPP
jgi:hypothetical protein